MRPVRNAVHSSLRDHRRSRAFISLAIFIALLSLHGCGSDKPLRTSSNKPFEASTSARLLNTPAGVNQSLQVVAAVLPLGAVPNDGMMLPLISPDGRYVATQAGAPPTWPTMLAETGQEVPSATQIEVFELDLREGIEAKDRRPPTLISSLAEPALLGRSCDSEGFLIESPRDDGSRWIGKVAWTSGEIEWLVRGNDINAFAALGPDHRLAWSHRTQSDQRFNLKVRHGDSEWQIGTPVEDWLMPTWSGRDDGLFAFNLAGGILEIRYGMASSESAMTQSLQRKALATDSKIYTAYQAAIGQSEAIDGSFVSRDQIVFLHPAQRRMALWRPIAIPGRQFATMAPNSVAALVDQDDFAMVALSDRLLRQNLQNPTEQIKLVAGTQIPRQTISRDWPYMLLSPIDRQVVIVGMHLLPAEDSIFNSR